MGQSSFLEKTAQYLERMLYRPTRLIAGIGMSFIMIMMILTAVDTVLRNFFNHPIVGAHEVSEVLMVIFVFLAIAYTAIEKGHVAVDFLTGRFPKRVQAIIDKVTNFLSLFIFLLITWQTFLFGMDLWKNKTVSPTLDIPIFPFAFIVAFGTGLLCLVLLINFLHSLSEGKQ